jgi:hypothetical protein
MPKSTSNGVTGKTITLRLSIENLLYTCNIQPIRLTHIIQCLMLASVSVLSTTLQMTRVPTKWQEPDVVAKDRSRLTLDQRGFLLRLSAR